MAVNSENSSFFLYMPNTKKRENISLTNSQVFSQLTSEHKQVSTLAGRFKLETISIIIS